MGSILDRMGSILNESAPCEYVMRTWTSIAFRTRSHVRGAIHNYTRSRKLLAETPWGLPGLGELDVGLKPRLQKPRLPMGTNLLL
jgi:hypothetical protein